MLEQIVSFIFVYLVTFWIVIFLVLPFGIKTEENPEDWQDNGAPKKANMKKKFFITAIITFFLTIFFFFINSEGIITMDMISR